MMMVMKCRHSTLDYISHNMTTYLLKRASLPIHSALGPPGPSLGSPWAFLGPALGSPWASPGLPLSLQCDTGNLSCVWLAGWLGGWLAAG